MGEKICVVGLGYVGLPLAAALARQFPVVGCDLDPLRVRQLQDKNDSAGQVPPADLSASDLAFTTDIRDAKHCGVFIVTVPTPIFPDHRPDLRPLENACRDIAAVLKRGDLVVIESTVYPGVTEEVCAPTLERESGLAFNRDFACGYSPERVSPGDGPDIADIVKITAGSTPAAAKRTAEIYRPVIRAGIHPAGSIRVAEAAKVLENTQRDVNIALMNEAAVICGNLGLDTAEVLAAAATKWNFLNFRPGLVGGHCIGVDPYYLSHKAQASGYRPNLILAARQINDAMGAHIAAQTLALLAKRGKPAKRARILILGFSFKENCADPRNSRVWDIIRELRAAGCEVSACDPVADPEKARAEYGLELEADPGAALKKGPDAVIFAVAHDEFRQIPAAALGDALVIDVKGIAPRRDWRL